MVLFFNISPEFHITLNNVSFMNCRCYGCSSLAESCEMKLAFEMKLALRDAIYKEGSNDGFTWSFSVPMNENEILQL